MCRSSVATTMLSTYKTTMFPWSVFKLARASNINIYGVLIFLFPPWIISSLITTLTEHVRRSSW